MMTTTRITLITGADQGIGYATAQALCAADQTVLVGARDQQRGEAAVAKLGPNAHFIQLDVTKEDQVAQAAAKINTTFGHLDTLINNAGVALDAHQAADTLPLSTIRADFEVNFFALVSVTQAMIPLLRASQHGKLINVSSNMGSLGLASDPASPFYHASSLGYQSSKAAVNMATINFAKALAGDDIGVYAVNPGWTATGFGGRDVNSPAPSGMQSIETGAAQIVHLATTDDTPTMSFTENAGSLPW